MELTAEIARELLTYNPDTGKLFWKERSKSKEHLLARLVQCSACMYWLRKKTSSSININLFLFFFLLDLNPDLCVCDRWALT